MYHNGCVHHIVFGDDLEWFPRTHHLGSLRQLLYRCTCCTCCTGTLGTAGTAAVQHTRIGQQLVYAVPAVPLYLLYRCTAVPAVVYRRGSEFEPSPAPGRACSPEPCRRDRARDANDTTRDAHRNNNNNSYAAQNLPSENFSFHICFQV